MKFRQVHLDFHTSEMIENIGKSFDKKQFQTALKTGHVDSITLFSKCHHGWAYHPSEANEMHPNLDFDLLGAQIEAAHELGIKTPIYLSAGFDEKIARIHPEWLFRFKDETMMEAKDFSVPGYHLICMNTPYLDYLLNQIKEVLLNYDADGIFLDIVDIRKCYCQNCIKSRMELGMDPYDEKSVEAHANIVYENYYKKVRETIDSIKPGLPVFHNAGHIRQGRRDLVFANSHLELESLPTGGWGYDHFPMSAAYAKTLNVDYLGMTGKFHTSWGEFGGYKHPNALIYETALSVSNGAKCSIGDQLAPSGKMDINTYKLIGSAYEKIEEKEEWLDNVQPVSDIALLSLESLCNSTQTALTEEMKQSDVGVGRILLEGKYLFSVIDTEADFNLYKVIILADYAVIDEAVKEKLDKFVESGGKLLATGKSAVSDNKFLFDFGAEYICEGEFNPSYIKHLDEGDEAAEYIMYTPYQNISATDGDIISWVTEPYFNREWNHFCSHLHTPSSGVCKNPGMILGNDGIYIAWEIFRDYADNGELAAKRTVFKALDLLLGENKSLKTNLGSMGVATLVKQNNRYIAHLLYAVPTKRGRNTEVIEDIYPVSGINLDIKVNERIKNVYLAPQMQQIDFSQIDGYVHIENITVDCHQMIVFDV